MEVDTQRRQISSILRKLEDKIRGIESLRQSSVGHCKSFLKSKVDSREVRMERVNCQLREQLESAKSGNNVLEKEVRNTQRGIELVRDDSKKVSEEIFTGRKNEKVEWRNSAIE